MATEVSPILGRAAQQQVPSPPHQHVLVPMQHRAPVPLQSQALPGPQPGNRQMLATGQQGAHVRSSHPPGFAGPSPMQAISNPVYPSVGFYQSQFLPKTAPVQAVYPVVQSGQPSQGQYYFSS